MLKFNNGNGANICDNCRIIIQEPYDTRKSPKFDLCAKCKLENIKMVILVRRDLKMSVGKTASQCAHAAMKVFFDRMDRLTETEDDVGVWSCSMTKEMQLWKEGIFTKIILGCNSEQELLEALDKANIANLPRALITDNGRTEFNGVHTNTCIAIGPDKSSKIDLITGNFTLL